MRTSGREKFLSWEIPVVGNSCRMKFLVIRTFCRSVKTMVAMNTMTQKDQDCQRLLKTQQINEKRVSKKQMAKHRFGIG